jgi:hypothetical protein
MDISLSVAPSTELECCLADSIGGRISYLFLSCCLLLTGCGEVEVPSPALWGKIIGRLNRQDGPVLVTAMNDLQQGGRVAADAGINLGCIQVRLCIETDGDRRQFPLPMANGLVCIEIAAPADSPLRASNGCWP